MAFDVGQKNNTNQIKPMKRITMIKTTFLACALGICAGTAQADEKTDAAVTAAKSWLALVDAKEYKKSWQEAAPFFKDKVKEEQWSEMVAAARKPLGVMKTRELSSAVHKTTLPGAPDGEYVVIQFKTSFTDKRESVETVTPMKADGTWRVSGYFIK
jgi:hypothetical protein